MGEGTPPRHGEAPPGTAHPQRGCLRPASETEKRDQTPRGVGRFHRGDAARTPPPPRGRARTPHRRPGVPTPPPPHSARDPQHARARVRQGRRPGRRGRSPQRSRGRSRAPHHGTPPRAHRPRPMGGRATPQGVFKPPRRNALGTWTAGGGRGGGDRRPAPDPRDALAGRKAAGERAGAGRHGVGQDGEEAAAAAAAAATRPASSTGAGGEGTEAPPSPPTHIEAAVGVPHAAHRFAGRAQPPHPQHTRTRTRQIPSVSPHPLPESSGSRGRQGPTPARARARVPPAHAPHGGGDFARSRGAAAGPLRALSVNDPSAGSPTETLLRLLLPLDSQVRPSSQRSARAVGRPRRGRSEGLTKPSNR